MRKLHLQVMVGRVGEATMHRLDDLQAIRRLDAGNMLANIADLPEQFSQAWAEAKNFSLPANYIQVQNAVILGMGASAIGGSFIKSLLVDQETIPVAIIRDYTLPSYVGRNTLVVAVTYSGNTEETVSAFTKAAEKGAKVVAITSDGEVERLASRFRAPVFKVSYGAQPRAALGYLFVPLLAVFSKLGLLEVSSETMAAVVRRMEERRDIYNIEVPYAKNPAKQLASKLSDRVVVMIGSGVLADAARRWKTQINENAKQAAFLEVMPELCHNTIVGLEYPRWQGKQTYSILLASEFDHPRNRLRMQLLPSLLTRRGLPHQVISANDVPGPVAEIAQTILLGDFVSYYLAILNGVDPTPVEPIEQLKKELAKQT